MFRGTRRIPNFDLPVQMACGDNNAFTNNDYTDFYITLPKDNVETALWLESATSTSPTATNRCCCGRWPTRSTPTAGPPSG